MEVKKKYINHNVMLTIIGLVLTAIGLLISHYYFSRSQETQEESNRIAVQDMEQTKKSIEENEYRSRKNELYDKISSAVGNICIAKDSVDLVRSIMTFDSLYYGVAATSLTDYCNQQMKSFHIILVQFLEGSDVNKTTIKLAAQSLQEDLKYAKRQDGIKIE